MVTPCAERPEVRLTVGVTATVMSALAPITFVLSWDRNWIDVAVVGVAVAGLVPQPAAALTVKVTGGILWLPALYARVADAGVMVNPTTGVNVTAIERALVPMAVTSAALGEMTTVAAAPGPVVAVLQEIATVALVVVRRFAA